MGASIRQLIELPRQQAFRIAFPTASWRQTTFMSLLETRLPGPIVKRPAATRDLAKIQMAQDTGNFTRLVLSR